MNTEEIKIQLNQAENDLKRAKRELYQPMEDVVSYCVCVSARSALYKYLLTLYLFLTKDENGDQKKDLSLEELIQLTGKKMEGIKNLSFDNINCKHLDVRETEDVYYCNDVEIVNHCTELADNVRDLLLEQLPPELKNEITDF